MHKYNMDVPGSSHMSVSWRPNLRGSMAWQLLGNQAPDFCFRLTHNLERLAVLLPLHPSPQPPLPAHFIYYGCKSFAASLLSLCLHSTLCSGSYRCCWNINSNTALIINPAGRWSAQAYRFVSQSRDSTGATFSVQPHFSVCWAAGKRG